MVLRLPDLVNVAGPTDIYLAHILDALKQTNEGVGRKMEAVSDRLETIGDQMETQVEAATEQLEAIAEQLEAMGQQLVTINKDQNGNPTLGAAIELRESTDELRGRLQEIKGVGEKTADEIIEVLEE